MQDTKYITLKEAEKISGYSADYIGQLIRRGKLPGKQVYCSVAWVTTEEAIHQYVEKVKHGGRKMSLPEKIITVLQELKAKVTFEVKWVGALKALLYATIALSILFSAFLFYILSVRVDKLLQELIQKRAETRIYDSSESLP